MSFVDNNPVNFVDPTGHIKEGPQAEKADLIVAKLHNIYNVRIRKDWGYRLVSVPVADLPPGLFTGILYYGCEWEEGNWRNAKELELTLEAVKNMSNKLGGSDRLKAAMKYRPIEVVRHKESKNAGLSYAPPINYVLGDVELYDNTFNLHAGNPNVTDSQRDIFAKYVVVHEMAHVWDFRNNYQLGVGLANHVNAYRLECPSIYCTFVWDPNQSLDVAKHFVTTYAKTNEMEFWADSFAASVYPNLWWYISADLTTEVKTYINTKINKIR